MIDVDLLKANTGLLALAERDTTLRRVAGSEGGEYAGACPFCGGRDRFRVQPAAHRWLCRHCTEGKWQDVIAYVMRREACDFRRACELLGAAETLPTRPTHIAPQPTPAGPPESSPPLAEWQAKACEVMAACEGALWAVEGQQARDWLHRRGLSDDTLRHWRIGYWPGDSHEWREIAGLRVPCGIVIPCEVGGAIWYLKTRRATGDPKYIQAKGSRPALFGADTLRGRPGRSIAVLCEGEFDAMLLWQEAQDLAGVATLGSATARLDVSAWGAYLLPLARLLIAYDTDEAGSEGAHTMGSLTARARLITVPGGNDITDYHVGGGNLRAWLAAEITKHGAQPADRERGDVWPIPAFIADFLQETANTITTRHGEHGERLTVAPIAGRSVFDELTSLPEPETPEAKADLARRIAAVAIREGRYGEDYPLPDASAWRAWADKWAIADSEITATREQA